MPNRTVPIRTVHERRLRVLAYIARFQERYGYPPTVRQIARGTGAHSLATVQRHIQWLITAGLLGRRLSNRQLWPICRPADET